MADWTLFYTGMGIFAIIALAAAIFSRRIKNAIDRVEYLASGHVTEHHRYMPFE